MLSKLPWVPFRAQKTGGPASLYTPCKQVSIA